PLTARRIDRLRTRTNAATGVSVKRFWHCAIQARPMIRPTLAYIVKSHVLFTNDGVTIWESKKRLASARRSQCKSWWNGEWRDRTLAAATYLSEGADKISVRLGSNVSLTIPLTPLSSCSPVSYTDPQMLRFSAADETA